MEIYGVPNYKKLYDAAGVSDAGELVGRSFSSDVFLSFLGTRAPGHHNPAPINEPRPPATKQQCRSCAAQRGCANDYQCIATVPKFQNTRLMEGCCQLDSSWISQGRRLLSNSSAVQGKIAAQPAPSSLGTDPALSDWGCACNCTYVSQACCGVASGVVHEASSLKLGSLKPPNSTTCCDTKTGTFQYDAGSQNSTYC